MKTVVGVALAVTIAAILLGPIVTAVNDNTGVQTVENETVTADIGNYTSLDGWQIDESSEVVYGYNDTSASYEQLTEGTDYEMDYEAGQIKALSGSTIVDDGEDMKVTYDYQSTDDMTTTIIGYGPTFLALLLLTVVGARVTESL